MSILFNLQRIMALAERYYPETNRLDPGKQVTGSSTSLKMLVPQAAKKNFKRIYFIKKALSIESI